MIRKILGLLGVGGLSASSILHRGVEAYISGRFAEAERLFTDVPEAKEALRSRGPYPVIAANNLAATYLAAGRFAESRRLYERVEEIWYQCFTAGDVPEPTGALNGRAATYVAEGDYDRAAALIRQVLAARDSVPLSAPDHDVVESLEILARLEFSRGQVSRAQVAAGWALGMREIALGPEHPTLVKSLRCLARAYRAQDRGVEAQRLEARAQAIHQKALGPEEVDGDGRLDHEGGVWDSDGRWVEAGALCERAVALGEASGGGNHVELARSLDDLASSHIYWTNRWINISEDWRQEGMEPVKQARVLYSRALKIRRRKLGQDHPDVATSLDNLARIEPRRYPLRFALVSEAWAISERPKALYEQALAIRERTFGGEHPALALSLHNLAEFCEEAARAPTPKGTTLESVRCALFRRALALREAGLGSDNPLVAESLLALATEYRADGRKREAEPLQRRALMIQESTLGSEHVRVVQTLHGLARLCYDLDRFTQAEELYEQLLAIEREVLSPDHPSLVASRNALENLRR